MEASASQLNRIWEAMLDGWAFTGWDRSHDGKHAHFVMVWSPLTRHWDLVRTPGDQEDWVDALLDEAEVPKYDKNSEGPA